MSVVFTEGFDMYNGLNAGTGVPVKWVLNNGGAVATAGGRLGGQSLNINSSNGGDITARSVFNGAGTTTAMSVGFAFETSFLRNDALVDILNTGLGLQWGVGLTAGGALTAYNAGGGTVITSAAGLLVPNTWYYGEAETVLSASVGTINLYLGGLLVGAATGLNTGAGAGFIQLRAFGGGFVNHWYDDIYVTDTATRLGESRIETIRPSSDSSVAWTPNSGVTNFSRVNETLVDGDTSYVQTATIGARDLYGTGGLSSTPAAISAVNVISFSEKTDATTRQIYHSVRSGVTDSDGPALALNTAYSRYERIMMTDPATSGAWTASGVNNLLIGPKAV